jgi:plastocyanin
MRSRYGINNRRPDGSAPTWQLIAMVMNHYRRPKSFFVRLRVYYTTDEQRESVSPIVVGNCSRLGNGMAYDVPGGGRKGSNFVDRTTWTVPPGLNGRVVLAASHHHGGAKRQTLRSRTCGRKVFDAPAYHGRPNHIYNTIRPILHEPGPIGNGTYTSARGIPIHEGEVFERAAVHDNSNLHVASMGFWVLNVVRDDSVGECEPLPDDLREVNRPRRFDATPNHALKVPQLWKPRGAFTRFTGGTLPVDDRFFRPGKVRARLGQQIDWSFEGDEPHSVTVANGPRGFSSLYSGQTRGGYSFTPSVRGTYRLTCLIHPTSMGQTLEVR